jgi:hypothetical protein
MSLSSTNVSASPHPFTALQHLASFMPSPFSWSGIRASPEVSSIEEKTNNCEKEKKGFVSKERQLARLRERMAVEEGVVILARARVMRQQQPAPVLPCRWCVDRVVAP